MKKIITIFISLIIIVLIGIYLFSITNIKNDIKSEFGLIQGEEKEWSQAFKEYDIFQCKFGVLNSEYVFVSHRDYSYRDEARELWKTTFYQSKRPYIFSFNWNTEYTGGTDIKNTTFPELVEMVKEDCGQFQYGYDNPDPDGPRWTYTAYIAEDVPSEEEKIKERLIIDANMIIKEFLELPQHQHDNVIKHYGGYEGKTAQEVIDWFNLVNKELEEGKFNFDKGML